MWLVITLYIQVNLAQLRMNALQWTVALILQL